MSNKQILMLITAFVTLTLGSFIWFIATWDPAAEQAIGALITLNPKEVAA